MLFTFDLRLFILIGREFETFKNHLEFPIRSTRRPDNPDKDMEGRCINGKVVIQLDEDITVN